MNKDIKALIDALHTAWVVYSVVNTTEAQREELRKEINECLQTLEEIITIEERGQTDERNHNNYIS